MLLAACAGTSTTRPTRPRATSTSPAPTTTTAGAASPGPLAWRSCSGPFQCARLRVPVDYARPADGSLELGLVRLPATDAATRLGSIVINPGGPGGSGVQFLEQSWQMFPPSLRARFDLVSFDPRGVGESDPVTCFDADQMRAFLALDPAPTTPAQVSQVATAERAFVASCERHTSRTLLANVGTVDAARDLDRLRAALGEARLTYLGFSYGTYLGAVYASLFPHHVRAMVLDGAVDPALGVVATEEQQAQGFETDLDDFFRWCDSNGACHSELPDGARAGYDALFASLERGQTVTADLQPALGGVQQVDWGVALTAVTAALYSEQYWPDLGQALGQARLGDASALAAFAFDYVGIQSDGSLDNLVAANVAINCLDRPSPTALATYESLSASMARSAPDFGAAIAWGSLACAYWPVPPQSSPGPLHDVGAPPVVVVGSTQDPATPYAWARALAADLSGAVLLTRVGAGHTGYAFSACVRAAVDRYFETLATPKVGTVCRS